MVKAIKAVAGATLLLASVSQVQAGGKAVACYQPVHQPAQYSTVHERVMVSPGSRQVITTPAEYAWRERRVMVRGESVSYRIIPAQYRTVSETVMVEPARSVARIVPGQTRLVHKTVMTHPGGYAWQWKVINGKNTLCKVKTKPVYGTVAEHVTGPSRTVYETVPARYATRSKTVMVSPERREAIRVPAVYDTVREKVMVRVATSRVVATPAVYETRARTIKVRDEVNGWKQVAIPRHCR